MMLKKNKTNRSGAALLVVLFVVFAATVLSLGYLSKSNVEVACGENMILRTQMDYLAESALVHARGLILTPQDASSEYWTGGVGQQIVSGSDDYYDITIARDNSNPQNFCNYLISCQAYRMEAGQKIANSNLIAELRLDPGIAYWQGVNRTIPAMATIYGDVYCDDNLSISGSVNGDIYAKGTITGSATGQKYSGLNTPTVALPGITTSGFSSTYYINSMQYSVGIIATDVLKDVTLEPTVSNPSGIYYRNGHLTLEDTVRITGMLVVKDDLKIGENANVIITAVKNFPALMVGRNMLVEYTGTETVIKGFAQINDHIDLKNKFSTTMSFLGALYILKDGIRNVSLDYSNITVTAMPDKAALEIWPEAGNAVRWTSVAGAFFKSIAKQ